MKKSLVAVCCLLASIFSASAADVKLFFSPSCPYCHYALDFLRTELAYQFPTINITAYNLSAQENMPAFQAALAKCKFESGGIPVMVIGEKCFQGYADFMKPELREAATVGLSDSEKQQADENVKAFEANPETFRAENAGRAEAVQEVIAGQEKKSEAKSGSMMYFYGLIILVVLGLGGFALMRKKKK